jgi:head-tail adaptor
MPDNILTAQDYAEIRAAVTDTFTDTVAVQARARVSNNQGSTYTYTTRSTVAGTVRDLSGHELVRAQQIQREAGVEVTLPALTTVKNTDRLVATHHQTGEVRTFEVVHVFTPSREFARRVLCKQDTRPT